MLKSSGYSLFDYGQMIMDEVRMPAYAEALRRHVKPGMVVADLGAATGVFSLLACQLGAARVYAIEPDPSILVARESAAANGFADRMICIEGISIEAVLPEKVDLVVSDMRGSLPLLDFHLPAIKDARERFLKPDGLLIPTRDVMRCAPVECPEAYARLEAPWTDNAFGLDLLAARNYILRTTWKFRVEDTHLLADAADWAVLDYATVSSPNVDGTMTWTIQRDGVLHGLCVWFDAEICDGIGFSNAPGQPETVYGRDFIPMTEPTATVAGDVLRVRLRADVVNGKYVYRWESSLTGAEGREKVRSSQSSFGSVPISKDALSARIDTHVPALSEQGRIDRFVLDGIAHGKNLREIAQALSASFPSRYSDWRRALDTVAELSIRYSV